MFYAKRNISKRNRSPTELVTADRRSLSAMLEEKREGTLPTQ
jgi:hypothetical protein